MAELSKTAIIEKSQLDLDTLLETLDLLKTKYKIKCVLYNKILLSMDLKSIQPKDIVVSKSRRSNDQILSLIANKEKISNDINEIKKMYNLYRDLILNKLVELSQVKSCSEMIVIYRDKMNFKWNEIAFIVKYSRSQTIEIYRKEKNRTLSDTQ